MLMALPGRGGLCWTVPVPSRVLYLLDICQGLRFFGGDILGLQTLSTGSQQFLHRDPPRCPGLPHVLLVHTPDSLGFLAFAPGKLTPRTQSGQ